MIIIHGQLKILRVKFIAEAQRSKCPFVAKRDEEMRSFSKEEFNNR